MKRASRIVVFFLLFLVTSWAALSAQDAFTTHATTLSRVLCGPKPTSAEVQAATTPCQSESFELEIKAGDTIVTAIDSNGHHQSSAQVVNLIFNGIPLGKLSTMEENLLHLVFETGGTLVFQHAGSIGSDRGSLRVRFTHVAERVITLPGETITVTLPGEVVTEYITVTLPGEVVTEYITVTLPGEVVTEYITVTLPGEVVTEYITITEFITITVPIEPVEPEEKVYKLWVPLFPCGNGDASPTAIAAEVERVVRKVQAASAAAANVPVEEIPLPDIGQDHVNDMVSLCALLEAYDR